MEIRGTEEARGNIEEFTTQILAKMMEKKAIDADIKEIKEEFKEEGVPVGIVCAVISRIKSEKKKTDTELFEMETIKEWLVSTDKIDDAIGSLLD